jgi:hypothetical protein
MICLLGGLIALAITYPLTLLASRFMPMSLSLPVVGLAPGILADRIDLRFPAGLARRAHGPRGGFAK